ncbi:MAG: ABC transporter ATP-binding protein, partial [Actinobacteria bacterium]|nr:ABC transporter ATP-binding protein [Actinomycetota bacterium]
MNADAVAGSPLTDVAPEPGSPKPDPILKVDNISKSFGGLKAVDVDHLEVQRDVITALIGPNGAGKTTFFNLISGFDTPDSGAWAFNDGSLSGQPAHTIARRGMVRTFQLTKALARLTVMQNMKLGATGQRGESMWRALIPPLWREQERSIEERADQLLERFSMAHMRNDFAGELSGGQRKLLEMARALMSSPEMVLLDEPTAGVNPVLKQSLLGHVREVVEEGTTVMFVEHDMDMVRDISDWVVVMGEGSIIAEGPHESIGRNETVIDAYLGAHHDQPLTFEEQQAALEQADEALDRESAITQ